MNRSAVLGAGAIIGALTMTAAVWPPQAHAQANPSIWDGIYTEAQAERGKTIFSGQCAVCHDNPPVGGNMGPGLIGDDFMARYNDSNLGEMFDRIFKTMPENEPGTLKPAELADLIAFLARSNRWPAGDRELPSDPDVLKRIQIVVRK